MIVRNKNISGIGIQRCLHGRDAIYQHQPGQIAFRQHQPKPLDVSQHQLQRRSIHRSATGRNRFQAHRPPPRKDGSQERRRPVTFEEAMLCDSVFRKVDLSNVQIIDCNIEGMKIDGVLVTEMIAAYEKSKRV